MKAQVLFAVIAFSAGSVRADSEVKPGASLAEVKAALGPPRGQLNLGARQILYYERGAVELEGGALTRVAMRTPEEHEVLVAREERLREEQQTRRAALVAEGTALRDAKLADATFQAAPVAYQVSFWEDFVRSYPGVSCKEPLTVARLRLNEQIEERRLRDEQADRLAEIEARYAALERTTSVYPARIYYPYQGRHHHYSAGLGPITYTFFDSPLPPYSTPSGNPAGNLTGLPINPSEANSAQSDWKDSNRSRGQHEDRPGRSRDRSSGYRRSYDRT